MEARLLDTKDLKILSELDVNARVPLSVVSKKTKLSKDIISYRLKHLEAKKVILSYYAVIDAAKIGYNIYRVFLKLSDISKENALIEYGKKVPWIGWIIKTYGEWDIWLLIWASTMGSFEEKYDDLMFNFSNCIENKYVSPVFEIQQFRHDYLYGTKREEGFTIGDDTQIVKLDETDIELLKILANNARTPTAIIAQRLRLSPNTIKARINRLLEKKVIVTFKTKVNTNLLGYDHFKVFLELENITKEKLSKLSTTLKMNPHVIYVTKALGFADIEFEIVVAGKNKLYEYLRALNLEFPDLIKNHKTLLFYEEPRIDYAPLT